MNFSLFTVLPRMLSRQNRKKGDSGAVPKAVLSESLSLDTTKFFGPVYFGSYAAMLPRFQIASRFCASVPHILA